MSHAPTTEPLIDRAPGVLPADAEHRRIALPGRSSLGLTLVPGIGEPVVWLHPSRTNRRVFDHAIAASRLGRSILVPELSGHGDSDRPAIARGLDDHVQDLTAFADVMGLDRFAIVGQATGATLGLMLATRLPDRVSALALGDVALGIRPSVYALVERQEQAFAATPFETPDAAMAATPFSDRWPLEVRAHWLATALDRGRDGLFRWRYDAATVLKTMAQMVTDRWAEIDVAAPTLLFRGGENDAIEAGEIQRALHRLPHAEAAEMQGANHRLCQDAPRAFAELTDQFLRRAA
ncbi:MAG: alpha/beta hydrolase [Pseudomonadota bacterium]